MKRYAVIMLVVVLCLALTGCDFWMDGSYHSVEPHQHEYESSSLKASEVTTVEQLQDALVELVEEGTQQSVIYMVGFEMDQLESIMDQAIKHTTQTNPVGAYAVEQIQYEIGTNTGRTAIAVNISYIHNRAEILRIKQTQNLEQAGEVIAKALDDCEAGVVILVEEYRSTDFAQWIQDYVDANPEKCMELPQVTAAVYPKSGQRRIVELNFTYQTSRDSLRNMQSYVEPVFRAAYLNVSGEESEQNKFSLMYSFLMERADYTVETSITPAYSLLRHGVGDCKAFATVYAAMCRHAGLDCRVVTGTREGEPWVWNMICVDGVYAHVDLLRSQGLGQLDRMSDAEMTGYVWDYSAYPAAEEIILPPPVETVPEQELVQPTEPTETTVEETVAIED